MAPSKWVPTCVDPLGDDHLGLQILRVIHLVPGIADPAGGMHAHGMREIDDFHGFPVVVLTRRGRGALAQRLLEGQSGAMVSGQ
jgi:hypothetical protein